MDYFYCKIQKYSVTVGSFYKLRISPKYSPYFCLIWASQQREELGLLKAVIVTYHMEIWYLSGNSSVENCRISYYVIMYIWSHGGIVMKAELLQVKSQFQDGWRWVSVGCENNISPCNFPKIILCSCYWRWHYSEFVVARNWLLLGPNYMLMLILFVFSQVVVSVN